MKYIFITILGIAESFKRWARPAWPDPTLPNPTRLDRNAIWRLISRELGDVKFWHNLHTSHQFVLLKFWIDIFDSLETVLFGNEALSVIFRSFFIITFDWNFEFWWFDRNELVQIYQNLPYFNFFLNVFLSIKSILGEKLNFLGFLLKSFSKYFQVQ